MHTTSIHGSLYTQQKARSVLQHSHVPKATRTSFVARYSFLEEDSYTNLNNIKKEEEEIEKRKHLSLGTYHKYVQQLIYYLYFLNSTI